MTKNKESTELVKQEITERDAMKKVISTQREIINTLEQQIKTYKKKNEQQLKAIEDSFFCDKEGNTFADIGGLDSVIDKLKTFQLGIDYQDIYEQFGVRTANGIMLYGKPGTGKTLLAKALSNELKAEFLELRIQDFVTKWVGEAEQNLDKRIKSAEEYYKKHGIKVVLFMDEAEQLFGKRDSERQHEVYKRCQNVLLAYMDGFKPTNGIIYVAATNIIKNIDPAVLRPGRFDYVIEIPRPTQEGLVDIINKQIAFRERKAKRKVFDLRKIGYFAKTLAKCEGTGADSAEVLRLAAERKIKEIINRDKNIITQNLMLVTDYDVYNVLKEYVNRTTLKKEYKETIGFVKPKYYK